MVLDTEAHTGCPLAITIQSEDSSPEPRHDMRCGFTLCRFGDSLAKFIGGRIRQSPDVSQAVTERLIGDDEKKEKKICHATKGYCEDHYLHFVCKRDPPFVAML